jgi:tRNA pseudouridine55 synthase
MALFGLLNIHKPRGWTSRDVVNRVQKLARPDKAGHAGTLDPLATGVLVVCIGAATRLIEYVQAGRKHYRATFLLGRESDTEDVEGDVRLLENPLVPTREEIERVLPQFVGPQLQRPPAYSALKIQGQRAYDLARQGKEVNLQPRPIDVFALQLVGYAYPEFVLDIECGGGTYVRSLGRDIAATLGTGAVMFGLVRTAIGPFHLRDACPVDELTSARIEAALLPVALAVAHLPRVTLGADDVVRAVQGKRITLDSDTPGEEVAAFDASGKLVALLRRRDVGWHPEKVFPPAE